MRVLCISGWYLQCRSPAIWVQGMYNASPVCLYVAKYDVVLYTASPQSPLYLWVSSEGKIPVPLQGSCKLQSWFPRPGTHAPIM